MNQSALAPSAARQHRSRFAGNAPEGATARVTVAWTPWNHDGASGLAPSKVELVAGPQAAPNRSWTCAESLGSNWVAAIAPARSSEVLLRARLGDDVSAKHLVLELAELLAFELRDSQSLIRVLFLPTTDARRASRRHA